MLKTILTSIAKHAMSSASVALGNMAALEPSKPSRILVALLKDAIEQRRIARDVSYAELTEDDVALFKRIVAFVQALMEPELDPEYPPSKGELTLRTLAALARAQRIATSTEVAEPKTGSEH